MVLGDEGASMFFAVVFSLSISALFSLDKALEETFGSVFNVGY